MKTMYTIKSEAPPSQTSEKWRSMGEGGMRGWWHRLIRVSVIGPGLLAVMFTSSSLTLTHIGDETSLQGPVTLQFMVHRFVQLRPTDLCGF